VALERPRRGRGAVRQDAVYAYGPFKEPASGRDVIVRNWIEGGVQPGLETRFEFLAVEGRRRRGVANWRVSFDTTEGTRVTVDGILVCDFDGAGRCTLHREWFERREDPADRPERLDLTAVGPRAYRDLPPRTYVRLSPRGR
jgi:hypothetical protein